MAASGRRPPRLQTYFPSDVLTGSGRYGAQWVAAVDSAKTSIPRLPRLVVITAPRRCRQPSAGPPERDKDPSMRMSEEVHEDEANPVQVTLA